ncbi:GcrA family cell cycle regulator [Thermaurantiacus sp.]
MAWTEERIALLTKYWQEGHSASQIAEALGEGLTRNAVIGKAHRLGLAARPSPLKGAEAKADAKDSRNRKRAPAAAPAAEADAACPEAAEAPAESTPACAPEAPAPATSLPSEARLPAPPPRRTPRPVEKPRRVTLLDLTDRICKWPIGHPDEPDFHFCGKPVAPSFPYCGEHCLIAYQSQQPRRDRPAGPPPPFRPNLPRVR